MKRLLSICALVLVIPFLIGASCGQEEPDPSCLILYEYRCYVIDSDRFCAVTYSVLNTGECTIYRVDIYWTVIMSSGTTHEEYTPVGPIESWGSEASYFTITSKGTIEDCSYTYVIADWEGN